MAEASLIIKVQFLEHGKGLPLPAQFSDWAAGMDLHAALEQGEVETLRPFERRLIPTGIRIALTRGYEAQVRPRSGLALKHGVTVLNSPGTIDADYRGEIKVILINMGEGAFTIRRGQRIAQLVVSPVVEVELVPSDDLDDTDRATGGFGSSGV